MSISKKSTHSFHPAQGVANCPYAEEKWNLSSILLRVVYLRTFLFSFISIYPDGLNVWSGPKSELL